MVDGNDRRKLKQKFYCKEWSVHEGVGNKEHSEKKTAARKKIYPLKDHFHCMEIEISIKKSFVSPFKVSWLSVRTTMTGSHPKKREIPKSAKVSWAVESNSLMTLWFRFRTRKNFEVYSSNFQKVASSLPCNAPKNDTFRKKRRIR